MSLRMTISAGNLSGIAARFRAHEVKVQRRARRVVKKTGDKAFALASERSPRDTGFMVSQLILLFYRDGLAYLIGFRAADFEKAGFDPYFLFVLHGTRFQPANDFITPANREASAQFRPEMRVALSARGA